MYLFYNIANKNKSLGFNLQHWRSKFVIFINGIHFWIVPLIESKLLNCFLVEELNRMKEKNKDSYDDQISNIIHKNDGILNTFQTEIIFWILCFVQILLTISIFIRFNSMGNFIDSNILYITVLVFFFLHFNPIYFLFYRIDLYFIIDNFTNRFPFTVSYEKRMDVIHNQAFKILNSENVYIVFNNDNQRKLDFQEKSSFDSIFVLSMTQKVLRKMSFACIYSEVWLRAKKREIFLGFISSNVMWSFAV